MELKSFVLNEALNKGVHQVAIKIIDRFFKDNITEHEKIWRMPSFYLQDIPTLDKVDIYTKTIRVIWRQFPDPRIRGAAGPQMRQNTGEWLDRSLKDKEHMKLKGKIHLGGCDLVIHTVDINKRQLSYNTLVDIAEHELNHVIDFLRSNGVDGNRRDKKDVDNMAADEFGIDTTPSNQTKEYRTSVKNKEAYEYWNRVANYMMNEKEFNQKINELATIAETSNKTPIFASFYDLITKLYGQHGFNTKVIFDTNHTMTLLRSKIYKRYRSRIIREPELWEAYGNIFQDGQGGIWLSGKLN
jgi:predicted SprT family Zn-dependent metalloprotease